MHTNNVSTSNWCGTDEGDRMQVLRQLLAAQSRVIMGTICITQPRFDGACHDGLRSCVFGPAIPVSFIPLRFAIALGSRRS
jgi:hypothetical protein